MNIAHSVFGLLLGTTVVVQFLVAYMAPPISGNHAGLCILVPGYAFFCALHHKWRGLAIAWAISFSGAVAALLLS